MIDIIQFLIIAVLGACQLRLNLHFQTSIDNLNYAVDTFLAGRMVMSEVPEKTPGMP